MTIKILAIASILSLGLLAPAMAFERDGAVHRLSRPGDPTNMFPRSFDQGDGTFVRKGTFTLKSGRTITYTLSGDCARPERDCAFTGKAIGPFGGEWYTEGRLIRERNGLRIVGDLTAPNGRTIDFERQTNGHWRMPQSDGE
ncbi:MAG TPA: hypothetical protein VGM83_04425 [Devosiaceae bacterium]